MLNDVSSWFSHICFTYIYACMGWVGLSPIYHLTACLLPFLIIFFIKFIILRSHHFISSRISYLSHSSAHCFQSYHSALFLSNCHTSYTLHCMAVPTQFLFGPLHLILPIISIFLNSFLFHYSFTLTLHTQLKCSPNFFPAFTYTPHLTPTI